ncbi:MAG: glycerate kinase [Kineosporiaceae bacterium]
MHGPDRPRVLVAPDKFKGSLGAAAVAAAVRDGLLAQRPDLDVRVVPVADGGDGTLEAAVAAGFDPVEVDTVGPTGEPVTARYARSGDLAVFELAEVVGLSRLPAGRPAPLTASTFGLGLLVAHALARGCRRLVLAVGGSASTDGGAGLLQALGARLTGPDGGPLPLGGAALGALAGLDLAGLHPALAAAEVTLAADVDNPLLGEAGAAAVYGPQKGATRSDVGLLEQALTRWAQAVAGAVGRDESSASGAGAAGGTGFAAVAVLGARVRPGIELVLDLVGFPELVRGAVLVVTGEGSLDRQTLQGKAPLGVTRAAARAGVPVVAVAGRCLLGDDELAGAGLRAVYPLSVLEPDPVRSMADAADLLRRVGATIAREQLPAAARAPDRTPDGSRPDAPRSS